MVVVLGKFESEYIHLLVNTILKLNILEKAVEMVGNIILGPEWSVDIILHCKWFNNHTMRFSREIYFHFNHWGTKTNTEKPIISQV